MVSIITFQSISFANIFFKKFESIHARDTVFDVRILLIMESELGIVHSFFEAMAMFFLLF
jgi:hypothetical protein